MCQTQQKLGVGMAVCKLGKDYTTNLIPVKSSVTCEEAGLRRTLVASTWVQSCFALRK